MFAFIVVRNTPTIARSIIMTVNLMILLVLSHTHAFFRIHLHSLKNRAATVMPEVVNENTKKYRFDAENVKKKKREPKKTVIIF